MAVKGKGDHMTDQEFLNLVLSMFNIERTVGDGTVETKLVELFKPFAFRECCMFSDWSFLIKTRFYDACDCIQCDCEGMDGYDGHPHGFVLPQDFMKVRLLNGRYNEGFSIKGREIWCDHPSLRLDYYSYDCSKAPVEFEQLAAYRCAIDISQQLDPQGNALKVAQSLHQITLTTLSNRDAWSTRRKNPEFDLDDTVFKVPGNPYNP